MKFFGITTYSPGGLFQVCFGAVHVRLWADPRPDLTGGVLSLVRRLAPAFAMAVAEARAHFAHCTGCVNWVCSKQCWNSAAGLCKDCAPNRR
jgi:hypothetical protein